MRLSILLFTIVLMHASSVCAQETRLDVPQPEHAQLGRFVGDWHFVLQTAQNSGSNPQEIGSGQVVVKMVGEYFVVSSWSGSILDEEYSALQVLGYDVARNEYTGHWIDSRISYRWDLSGSMDKASGELVIATRGPAPEGGITAFRERSSFTSPDSLTIIGEMQVGEAWVPISTTRLTRLLGQSMK